MGERRRLSSTTVSLCVDVAGSTILTGAGTFIKCLNILPCSTSSQEQYPAGNSTTRMEIYELAG